MIKYILGFPRDMRDHKPMEVYGPYRDNREPYHEIEIHYPPFGDPYPQYHSPTFYTAAGSKGGMFSFTQREIRELLMSIGILTFAFSMVLGGRDELIVFLIPSFIAVLTGFFLHEMGHKFVAQSYGLYSEFRMSMQGLMLALLTSFAGFLIAAPGAVVISGYPTREQSGKTALAGPGVNVLIALIFLPLLFTGIGFVTFTASLVIFINSFLALFNLIPVRPLDGEKIVNWSIVHYIGVGGTALFLFVTALLFT